VSFVFVSSRQEHPDGKKVVRFLNMLEAAILKTFSRFEISMLNPEVLVVVLCMEIYAL
jgi:hypothetical protein